MAPGGLVADEPVILPKVYDSNRPQNWEPNAAAHAAIEQFYALRQPWQLVEQGE